MLMNNHTSVIMKDEAKEALVFQDAGLLLCPTPCFVRQLMALLDKGHSVLKLWLLVTSQLC